MKIFLASDHAGFNLKESVKSYLTKKGDEVIDCGALSYDPDDDYVGFMAKAAIEVSKDKSAKGIIFGGSGQAEAMVANKIDGIRCALFYGKVKPSLAVDVTGKESDDPYEMIRLTREHNDSNMISIAARFVDFDVCNEAIDLWLSTPFSFDQRHVRRIEKIHDLEKNRNHV